MPVTVVYEINDRINHEEEKIENVFLSTSIAAGWLHCKLNDLSEYINHFNFQDIYCIECNTTERNVGHIESIAFFSFKVFPLSIFLDTLFDRWFTIHRVFWLRISIVIAYTGKYVLQENMNEVKT